ncbi:hypothetical protein V8F33_013771 [Rhypophila sp. PSN 637]
MSSSDKVNQLFWLAYGQAIKDKAGANFGKTGAFFLASEAQKGPPAGSAVPDDYTNTGLYDIANNLLATDNLFYNTSALHGYAEALSTYLNWVDLGSHASKALDTALLNTIQDQSAAENAYQTQRKKAVNGFVPEGQTLTQWIAAGNAPKLTTATKNRDAAAAQVIALQDQIAGPLAAQLTNDRTKLSQGMNKNDDIDGFNMHCAVGNVLSPQELIRALNNGEKVPKPTFQRLRLYQSAEYKAAVEAMERKIGTSFKPSNSVSFTVDYRKDTSEYNFGQTTAGASLGVSWAGWFSFNAGGSFSESKSIITTAHETENVSVKTSPKYTLRSDAPKEAKALARVTSLVMATGLGYEITVGSGVAETVDNYCDKTVQAGGSISIFGIPIGVGGSGSSTDEKTSHMASWDSESKTFKVFPAEEAGYATVVGLMGEKFNIL